MTLPPHQHGTLLWGQQLPPPPAPREHPRTGRRTLCLFLMRSPSLFPAGVQRSVFLPFCLLLLIQRIDKRHSKTGKAIVLG